MDFDYVRFTVCDLNGCPRGKTVTKGFVNEALEEGIGAAAATILALGPLNRIMKLDEIKRLHNGNVILRPETKGIYGLPWASNEKYRVGEVLCEPHWSFNNSYAPSVRSVARKQLERLGDRGFELMSATEMEFILEDADTGKPVYDRPRPYESHLVSKFGDLLFGLESEMHSIGIRTRAIHTEDFPGQFELVMAEEPGITAADNAFILKNGLKEKAAQQGMVANFMAKPRESICNAPHFNHSLWTNDLKTNVFYDISGPGNMSEVALNWLGGLCKHGRGITALCSPTRNGYQRDGIMSLPHKSDWGFDNRDAAFRVKNGSHKSCLVENRMTAACNPYLVLAGTVAAGLDGIINKIECPSEADPDADVLPLSLAEALDTLQEDAVIVDALGPDIIRWFVESKKQIDLAFEVGDLEDERMLYRLYI